MNITILGSINSGFFWRSCFLTISGHGELSNLLMSTLPHCSHFVGIKVCRVRLRNPGLSMTVMTVRVAGVALLAFFLPALAAQEECDDSLLACCVLQLGRARSILWWCISIYIYIHIMICIYIYILLLKKSRKVPCWFLLEISKYWAGNHMFNVVAYSLFFFGLFVGESGHGSWIQAGWWFQTCFFSHDIWDNPSHWLIFFKMVIAPPTSKERNFSSQWLQLESCERCFWFAQRMFVICVPFKPVRELLELLS